MKPCCRRPLCNTLLRRHLVVDNISKDTPPGLPHECMAFIRQRPILGANQPVPHSPWGSGSLLYFNTCQSCCLHQSHQWEMTQFLLTLWGPWADVAPTTNTSETVLGCCDNQQARIQRETQRLMLAHLGRSTSHSWYPPGIFRRSRTSLLILRLCPIRSDNCTYLWL